MVAANIVRKRSSLRQADIQAADTEISSSIPFGSDNVQSLDPTTQAATKIARAWRHRRLNTFAKKQVLTDRLEMEDRLCVGISRLALFSIIFILLVQCNDVGVPKSVRLGVSVMLEDALHIDEYKQIRTLDGFQQFLSQSSSRLKKFSVSSNSRLPDPDALQILREREEFVQPVPMLRVHPSVTKPAFSISAWVQPLQPGDARKSILRQPLQDRNDLSCWGWFYPEQLRYGAHDFHALEEGGNRLEEVVQVDAQREGPDGTALVHVVMVVDQGSVTFYRNGLVIGSPQPLPRNLTGCLGGGAVELGDGDVALAAVEFRPRALASGEVDEIFRGGQPLAEIATGTELRRITEDPFEQVQIAVQDGAAGMRESVEALDQDASTRAVVTNAKSDPPPAPDDNPQFPTDAAPTASLLLGDEGAQWLSDRERAEWEAGGKPQHMPEGKWVGSPGDADAYWQVLDAPVYADTFSEVGVLPGFEEFGGSDGLSISFWYKCMFPESTQGPWLTILRGDEEAGLISWMAAEWVDAWVTVDYEEDGLYTGEYLSIRNPKTQKLDEKFAIAAFAAEPGPAIWRFMVIQYDAVTGSVRFFLDGKRVFDSLQGTNYLDAPTTLGTPRPIADVFGNASVRLHDDEDMPVVGKFAQMRVHPRLLSAEEISAMHEQGEWAEGARMKQCVQDKDDFAFHDTMAYDDSGLDCAWYYRVSFTSPKVCSAPAAKRRCPFTCRGVRVCHDGSLDRAFTAPPERRKFRVFDRVMHLRPKVGQASVICPSNAVDTEELIARCERYAGMEGFHDDPLGARNFSDLLYYTWKKAQRADVRDCQQLRARLDSEQCGWDASWLPEFEKDWNQTREWSVRFWLRATPKSKGMPENFYPTVHLFSSLAPPLLLLDWFEPNPELEAWMIAHAPLGDVTDTAAPAYPEAFAEIYPTAGVRYESKWTMFYAQLQQLDGGGYMLCATLNAMPLSCKDFPKSETLFDPRSFLEAVEFTTELLVAPIEVSTQTYSPSEVQELYYSKMVHMESVRGPITAEVERQAELREARVNLIRPYSERIALVAPPVLFQTRLEPVDCTAPVTAPFFKAQFELMLAAHCSTVSCPFEISDVMQCKGSSQPDDFFGLGQATLGQQTGFADFLYTMSDSPVLVRSGNTLYTDEFLDSATSTATVIAVFHLPNRGLTSVLELHGDFSGADLETSMRLFHLDYMPHERRHYFFLNYGALLVMLLFVTALNIDHLVVLRREARTRALPLDMPGVVGVLYDLFQVVINMVFGVIALNRTLTSEGRAERILAGIASVPFADSGVDFSSKVAQFFAAIDDLNVELAANDSVNLFAFVIMLLMLLRILHATAVHPRMGVLVGTLYHGLNDLWHFSLLFLIVFVFFSYTASWLFGDQRREFVDMTRSMKTQFDMVLGDLPTDFIDDARMVTYVLFSMAVMFFLMLNFLLAIVVEGYMRVREDIEKNESEREFTQDVVLTIYAWFKGKIQGWPDKREVAYRLRHCVASGRITPAHIWLQGFPCVQSSKMFAHYFAMEEVCADPPAWFRHKTKYDVAEETMKRSKSFESLSALALPPNATPPQTDKVNGRAQHSADHAPAVTAVTGMVAVRELNGADRAGDGEATERAALYSQEAPAAAAAGIGWEQQGRHGSQEARYESARFVAARLPESDGSTVTCESSWEFGPDAGPGRALPPSNYKGGQVHTIEPLNGNLNGMHNRDTGTTAAVLGQLHSGYCDDGVWSA